MSRMSFFVMRLFCSCCLLGIWVFLVVSLVFWLNYLKRRKNIFLTEDVVEQNSYLCNNKYDRSKRMMKRILYAAFSMMLLMGVPQNACAANSIEIIDNDIATISISVSESTLRVTGASGLMLTIYNVAGVHVQSFRVEGADRHYELNLPKGCYIVKVGKVVRKISIK